MRYLWRAPAFWSYEKPTLSAIALSPFAQIYGVVAARRLRQIGVGAPLPVLCVGNLVVGGAGKTPVALALAERLIRLGEQPWFATRGYRSRAEHGAPLLVDLSTHNAHDVGDEALLLARVAPTLVSKDRVAAAALAAAAGASVLILDDGLQNPALRKDWSLCVVDAEAGIGNGLCLPAGPLRAPLDAQLNAVNAVLILGEGPQGDAIAKRAAHFNRPELRGRLGIAEGEAPRLKSTRVYAFAGIGQPKKFFASLREAGANIVGSVDLADHYAYRANDIARLQRAAKDADALLVTTEKDMARLDPALVDPVMPAPHPIPAKIEFSDETLFEAEVKKALARTRSGRLASVRF
jgi:tetraacyldisaccharide 4'-kinase